MTEAEMQMEVIGISECVFQMHDQFLCRKNSEKKKEEEEAMWAEYIEQRKKQRKREEEELQKLKERQVNDHFLRSNESLTN